MVGSPTLRKHDMGTMHDVCSHGGINNSSKTLIRRVFKVMGGKSLVRTVKKERLAERSFFVCNIFNYFNKF